MKLLIDQYARLCANQMPPYPSLIIWRMDDGQWAARAGNGETVTGRMLEAIIPEAVTEALVSESFITTAKK
jgi:hypothetical protein